MVILGAALAGAATAFVTKGVALRYHRRRLARTCRSGGLEFTAEDPFETVQSLADFSLVSMGHSARVRHVAHGKLGPWQVRCFELMFEVGHGVLRHARLYAVAVAEVPTRRPPAMLWRHEDLTHAPLSVFQAQRNLGPWICAGDAETGRALAAAAGELTDAPVSIEFARGWLMVFAPADRAGRTYPMLADALPGMCDRLQQGELAGGDVSARQARE